MENNKFKIRIIDFYKDVDKPIIDNMINNESFKNILELSTVSEIPLLKKDKNNWSLKDKRVILKDLDNSKKKKIKEIKNNLSKLDEIKIIDIKESNNKLMSDLESINILKNKLEDDEFYNNLKNISKLSNGIELIKKSKTQPKQKGGNKEKPYELKLENSMLKSSIKIIDIEENKLEKIKLNIPKNTLSSDSDDFIEIFSN